MNARNRNLDITTDAHEMRERFEKLASDPTYKFATSRKGNYVNPALARDWKWFLLGRMDATRHPA